MKSLIPNSRRPDITFHASGRIDISARIARRLSLSTGDVIDILSHDDELYLRVRLRAGAYIGRHEGRVWGTNHGRGTFRACSRSMTAAVLSAAGATSTLRCPCGMEFERDNKKYITIIYRCPL